MVWISEHCDVPKVFTLKTLSFIAPFNNDLKFFKNPAKNLNQYVVCWQNEEY